MGRRQASVFIALVAVLILVVVGVGVALLMRDPGGREEGATTPAPTTSSAPGADPTDTVDAAEMLAAAGVDVVLPPPVPDAPAEWGDYRRHTSWEGRTRVFEASGPTALAGPDNGVFPASQNACGIVMFHVSFRAVDPDAVLRAELRNAIGDVVADNELNSGWMLGTNCATPYIGLAELPGEGNLTDVVYTVNEYRQSSIARQPQPQPDQASVVPSTSSSVPPPAEPALVECLIFDLGPQQGRYSDGSVRQAPECQDHPDYLRMLEAERVCGGMYGWMDVSAERYRELCGMPPPTDRTPPPTPEPEPLSEEPSPEHPPH